MLDATQPLRRSFDIPQMVLEVTQFAMQVNEENRLGRCLEGVDLLGRTTLFLSHFFERTEFEFRSFGRPGGASGGCAGGLSSPRALWRLAACLQMAQGSEDGMRGGSTLEVILEKLMREVGC